MAYKNKYAREKQQQSNDGGITWTDVPDSYRRGRLIEEASDDCNTVEWRDVPNSWFCVSDNRLTQWVEDGYACNGYNKHINLKQQESFDGGNTWTDTGKYNFGDLVEVNSEYCNYVEVQVRWVEVQGEYVCDGYTKYKKEIKQTSTDGETWVDTTETRAGAFVEDNSQYCGYSELTTQWVEDGNYVCDCFDKYAQEKQQIQIEGQWVDNGNTRKGSRVIEEDSFDCGYNGAIFRWVVDGTVCYGTDKYEQEKEQKSEDKGQTWEDTGYVRKGELIETDSSDCQYVPGYDEQYFTIESLEDGNKVVYRSLDGSTGIHSIYYSLDNGETWRRTYDMDVTLDTGEKILMYGYNSSYSGSATYLWANKRYKVYGNIMSLLYGQEFKNQKNIDTREAFSQFFGKITGQGNYLVDAENLVLPATNLSYYCYYKMFLDCTSLEKAPKELPATNLASNCYELMFEGCTSLTSAPSVLPATTLADYCYSAMFGDCTSLTDMPQIMATTESAGNSARRELWHMFSGCTSLVNVYDINLTTMGYQTCQGMFLNCTSLTTAPTLAATTLGSECYYEMFRGCTSLTNVQSILPAETLTNSCYYGMFRGCTSLTTAPILPAETLTNSCYRYMFNGCTSLNYVKMMAISITDYTSYNEWLYNVSPTGTFVKNVNETYNDNNVIPSGWTVETATQ